MTVHEPCGAPVEAGLLCVLDLDGRQHLCRDYLAWHLPADRRDPAVLDVPDTEGPQLHLGGLPQ